jgi:ABC-2 type transport system permease protein
VVQVGLDAPGTDKYDALLVAQLSSLTQPQMDNLLAYLQKGHAGLLFDDPFPAFNPRLAPNEPKAAPGRGMMGMMPQPPGEKKGNLSKFLHEVGLSFPPETIIWDTWNPHRSFEVPREVLFVGRDRFNSGDPISSGLQEMALIYAGEVHPRGDMTLAFTPLLSTTPIAGGVPKNDLFQSNFFGGMQRMEPRYRPRGQAITLAARVKGSLPAKPETAAAEINVMFCADLDCISDSFFQMRRDAPEGLQFDNVTFVLNCVDVLSGDLSYVDLRKRRPKHRTLEKLEALRKDDEDRRLAETKVAEEKAEEELKDAQGRLDAKVEEIRKRADIDERQKEIQLQTVQQAEQKKFQGAQREIEDRKKAAIEKSVASLTLAVRGKQRVVKILAVILPPIPPLLIGIYVLMRRLAAQGRTV